MANRCRMIGFFVIQGGEIAYLKISQVSRGHDTTNGAGQFNLCDLASSLGF